MQKRPTEDELDQRSTKKQKIESSSNFWQLPKDILLEICHYITRVEDIMRFEITCKTIRSLMAEEFTELHIMKNDYFEHIQGMLSRDLRYLNKLSLDLRQLKLEQNNWLVNKLSTVLPDLRNLTSLKLNFEYGSKSEPVWKMTYARVCDAIKKMTWLEVLDYQYPLISDLGEAFANHNKLTELIISSTTTKDLIETIHIIKGFDKLTQVKALTLHSQMTDNDMFNEVLQLTNLTALDMGWTHVSYDTAKNISCLTNLERLLCPAIAYRGPWKSLLRLPKLTSLEGDISTMKDGDSMEDLNKMTQLTSLDLSDQSNSNNLSPKKLSNLTNLQKLAVNDAIGSANFGVLSSLTQLSIQSWNIMHVKNVTLPQRLKHLELLSDIDARIFKEVVILTSLENLSIVLDYTWEKPNLNEISNLTNLKELHLVYGSFPPGLEKSLEKLPLLRSLFLSDVCKKDIAQLKYLTQINQLEVTNINVDTDLETLRKLLPFIVYKGEVDEEYEEDDEDSSEESSEEEMRVSIVPGAFQII